MAWTQLGQDLVGLQTADRFGRAVAISSESDTIVIGAPQGLNDTTPGYAAAYALVNGNWVGRGDVIEGEADDDNSGFSVAISATGTTMAIGAYLNDPSNSLEDAGHVRVFSWANGAYEQIGQDIDGDSEFENCGYSVALSASGTIVALSSDNYNQGRGRVRVFRLDGNSWVQRGNHILGDPDRTRADSNFGYSIDISGDGSVLVVGCPNGYISDGAPNQGYVQAYRWNTDTDAYEPYGSLLAFGQPTDEFGERVSISRDGTTLAVAVPNYENYTGLVRVFRFTGSDWVQLGSDIIGTDEYASATMYTDLSASGNVLVVGTPYRDDDLPSPGIVRVYDFADNQWRQRGPDLVGDADDDYFGRAVGLSASGDVLVVGASQTRNSEDWGNGYVRAFRWRAASVPCFHGSVRLPMINGLAKPASDVRVGMVIMDHAGHPHVVRHVTRTEHVRGCVRIAAGALGPNVPSGLLIVTGNHLVRLDNRIVRADSLVDNVRVHRLSEPLTVYHVGLDDWTFVIAHNMHLETLAWKPEHHAKRPRIAK